MSKQLTKTELTDIRMHWWQCRHTPPSRMSVTGVDAVGEHLVSVVELVVWSPESMPERLSVLMASLLELADESCLGWFTEVG